MIVDAHLDLAYNVVRGRDVTKPAVEQRELDNEIPTVGLPDLRAGDVRLVCATIFCIPRHYHPIGYETAEEARAQSLDQMATYQSWIDAGLFRWVKTRDDLADLPADKTSALLLIEGADALRNADDVREWHSRGLRICGLAWRKTFAAGGTGMPGPLTPLGHELVKAFDEVGVIHDASHLAEESFWDLMKATDRPVIASHSNCRVIAPGDRQLSDDMLRAIIARGGVIGLVFYDKFLLPPDVYKTRRVTLDDLVAHARHICDLAGNTNHVAQGTDMDGGLGREQIPVETPTSEHLAKVGDALQRHGFTKNDAENVLSANWMRFFSTNL